MTTAAVAGIPGCTRKLVYGNTFMVFSSIPGRFNVDEFICIMHSVVPVSPNINAPMNDISFRLSQTVTILITKCDRGPGLKYLADLNIVPSFCYHIQFIV